MIALDAPHRICLIRPSALGDVCRTVPVLASLRRAFPEARIDWVVQDDFAPAIEAHPALSELVRFPRGRLAGWWRGPGRALEMLKWFGRLRERQYDLVIDCQGLSRSGLMALASGAPRRIGLRCARELAWLGYTERLPRSAADRMPPHTVDQMLVLVEGLGVEPLRDMRLYAGEAHRHWWTRTRRESEMHRSEYAVLAPMTRWASKRWPLERFGQLVEPLLMRGFERIVVMGSPGDVGPMRPLMEDIAGSRFASALLDLVGQTTIGQTMAIIAEAGIVIANDSAPLHMAVGFDRPCVGLYGPTDPAVVGPYRRERSVVRGYAARPFEAINFKDPRIGDRLMRFISTAAVIQAIDRELAEHEATSRRERGWGPARQRAEPKPSGGVVEGAA